MSPLVPPPTFTVRPPTPGDEDALVRSTMGNAFESEGLELDEETVRRAIRRLLADPDKGRVFVADLAGKVVGTTYVTFEWSDWHDAWYWWIQSVFVAPENRGTGVYSALYRAIQRAAKEAGDVRAIRLYVERSNGKGLRAYRGHGMQQMEYLVFESKVGTP